MSIIGLGSKTLPGVLLQLLSPRFGDVMVSQGFHCQKYCTCTSNLGERNVYHYFYEVNMPQIGGMGSAAMNQGSRKKTS